MSKEALKERSAETARAYTQGNIANLDDRMTRRLIASTVMTESSGGNLSTINAQGYAGRYQAGAQWLVDAGYVDGDKLKAAMRGYRTEWAWADAGKRDNMDRFLADPSNWKNGLSLKQYLSSAELQDQAFKINSDAAYKRAIREGVLQETDPPEKIAGFLKARHISGYGGAKAAVRGGREIEDSNGTSNYDYYNDIAINRDGLNGYIEKSAAQNHPVHGENQPRVQTHDHRTEPHHVTNVLKLGAHGADVEQLQRALAAFGYTDKDGKPLAVDRDFGLNTEHALRAFQRAHGIAVDGKAGSVTERALAHANQHPLVNEATHPAHRLYVAIGAGLPSGTDPTVVANVTVNAVENGITSASMLKSVDMAGSMAFLRGTSEFNRARVDLQAPTPPLLESSEYLQMHVSKPVMAVPTRQQTVYL